MWYFLMLALMCAFGLGYWYRGWVHTITLPPSTGESLVE